MGFNTITSVIEVGSPFILFDYLDQRIPDSFRLNRKYGVVDSNGKIVQLKDRLRVYPEGSMVLTAN